MKTGYIILIAIVVLAIFTGMWFMGSYNTMITQNEQVETAWAQVEAQYQRRFDLVPNLVSATKSVLTQEQEVFGAIADARTRYAGTPAGSEERVEATNGFESALGRLLLIMENYPELRSVESVQRLTDELAGTENRISVERNRYNEQVRVWNTSIKRFPRSILAGMFGFETRTFFESAQGSENVVEVDLTL